MWNTQLRVNVVFGKGLEVFTKLKNYPERTQFNSTSKFINTQALVVSTVGKSFVFYLRSMKSRKYHPG